MSPPLASCRTCGASVIWVQTERGHAMPVDAVPPLLGGNVELLEQAQGDPIAKVHGATVFRPGWYVSHFSSCPDRDKHRKPKQLRPDGKRR